MGSALAAAVALLLNYQQWRRERQRALHDEQRSDAALVREERREVYSAQLAAAQEVEQLLHRVLNNRMRRVPRDLRTRIEDANVRHAMAHARIWDLGSAAVIVQVDALGRCITGVMRNCRIDRVDLPAARKYMDELKRVHDRVLGAMQHDLVVPAPRSTGRP